MSVFTFAISCLTASNLPWFINVTFQIPMLFTASDFTSITSHIHSWVLLFLWLCPFILSGVTSPLISSSILGTYRPGELIFSVLSFCLFILFMGFSRQEYWSGLQFPSSVDHILSELSTMSRPSWVALHGMASQFHWVRQGCDPHGSVWISKFLKRWEYQTTLPASWETCMQVKMHQLELDTEQWTGPKLEKSTSRLYVVTLLN